MGKYPSRPSKLKINLGQPPTQIIGNVLFYDRIRLFVHYTISLSSLCNLIWRHWTYKMPLRYMLSSVWVRYGIFSQLSIIQYVGLCFQFVHFLVLIERIYILCLIIIIKSEVLTITHYLGLGHETMGFTVCLFVFLRIRYLERQCENLKILFIFNFWGVLGK